MIPENLQEKWELAQARAEVLFLADNGGPGLSGCSSADPRDRRAWYAVSIMR